MERREFMAATGAGIAAATLGGAAAAQPVQSVQGGQARPTGPVTAKLPQHPDMKYRPLGRTGEWVSMIGLGGFHLAKPGGLDADGAVRVVHAAMDAGVTFFDNCWDYNGGESEVRLGRALEGGRRDRVFLMTKIDGRTTEAAQQQIDQSLQRLKTDHLDLLQFHEIIRMDDPERVFSAGAIDVALRARDQGKIRYIGFTGHKSPAIHRHMFEVADQHGFHFDTVQMPLNVMDAHFDSFEQGVLPLALQHGTAVLGMKTFGDAFIVKSGVATPTEMLHYSMSLPTALQVCGIDSPQVLQQALDAVKSFVPLTPDQRQAILAKTADTAKDGGTERYKTSHHFDGTIQNPHWLG